MTAGLSSTSRLLMGWLPDGEPAQHTGGLLFTDRLSWKHSVMSHAMYTSTEAKVAYVCVCLQDVCVWQDGWENPGMSQCGFCKPG